MTRKINSWLSALGVCIALSAAPTDGRALPPEDPASRPALRTVPPPQPQPRAAMWVGEHVSLGAGVGTAAGLLADTRMSINARAATLLQLLDVEARLDVGMGPNGQRYGGTAQLNMHPAFIAMVWRNVWGIIASGFHGFFAVGVSQLSGDVSGLAIARSLGIGLDVPLMGLERSDGLWLTGRAGWRWLAIEEGGQEHKGYGGCFAVSVAWRWYDVLR